VIPFPQAAHLGANILQQANHMTILPFFVSFSLKNMQSVMNLMVHAAQNAAKTKQHKNQLPPKYKLHV
jgi:hypothetical protein